MESDLTMIDRYLTLPWPSEDMDDSLHQAEDRQPFDQLLQSPSIHKGFRLSDSCTENRYESLAFALNSSNWTTTYSFLLGRTWLESIMRC